METNWIFIHPTVSIEQQVYPSLLGNKSVLVFTTWLTVLLIICTSLLVWNYMECKAMCCTVIFCCATKFRNCSLPGKPNANSIEFRDNWKPCIFSKQTTMELASCGLIGFSIGLIGGVVKVSSGLTIADSILNSIATLVPFVAITVYNLNRLWKWKN